MINKEYKKAHFKKSFLNYPGGKYRLLPQLLPLFPDKVDRFVDLFAGSAVVSTNYSNTDSYLINDNNIELINLIKYVSQSNIDDFLFKTKQIIEAYGLSDTSSKGYYFYGLNSNEGLSQYNKQGYLKLRTDFNSGLSEFSRENQLYVLTVYAFNNQIRFNHQGLFNSPVGKRDFNLKMKEKLFDFTSTFKCDKKIEFSNLDFRNVNIKPNDFIYADPPYLIADAVYNENSSWNVKNDLDLMSFLDHANQIGARFALSNVFVHKEMINHYLIEWSKKYCVFHLKKDYNNSNYHSKNSSKTDEVLITNY